MKRCPACGATYDDDSTLCARDAARLRPAAPTDYGRAVDDDATELGAPPPDESDATAPHPAPRPRSPFDTLPDAPAVAPRFDRDSTEPNADAAADAEVDHADADGLDREERSTGYDRPLPIAEPGAPRPAARRRATTSTPTPLPGGARRDDGAGGRAPDPHGLAGRVLGDYRLLEQIGEGGMGVIFRAEHVVERWPAAVKILLGTRVDRRPELLERFLREARAASDVGHPGVVRVYAFDTDEDVGAYLVMELVEGRSLAQELAGGVAFEPARAAAIGLAVADALQAVHDRAIVHRDLKPDNLMLVASADGRVAVKVLDFGVAKLTDALAPATRIGTLLGTPSHMSPEQCMSGPVDQRADVYALGVVLFQMLTGRLPFDGSSMAILSAHLHRAAPAPSTLAPAVPPLLDQVVLRCLRKDREERFPSMRALAEALAVAGASVDGSPAGVADAAVPHPIAQESGRTGLVGFAAPSAAPPRRLGALGLAVGALVAAAIGAAVTVFLASR